MLVFWYENEAFTILLHIYSSYFANLRHICKEHVCANPFFCDNIVNMHTCGQGLSLKLMARCVA